MKPEDFKIIKKAGLGQLEFADLIPVSRVTVNNWVSGKTKPNKHVVNEVKRNIVLLRAAYRLRTLPGDIPTMHQSNVESRREYIRDRLDDAAKKLRESKAKRQAAKK